MLEITRFEAGCSAKAPVLHPAHVFEPVLHHMMAGRTRCAHTHLGACEQMACYAWILDAPHRLHPAQVYDTVLHHMAAGHAVAGTCFWMTAAKCYPGATQCPPAHASLLASQHFVPHQGTLRSCQARSQERMYGMLSPGYLHVCP